MRAGGAPVAALLLISASLVIQVTSEDLYWEGEEDASNEFLEVKDHDDGIVGRLSRMKRDWSLFDGWGVFSGSSSTSAPEPENIEESTADSLGGVAPYDDETGDGSGAHGAVDSPEPKEKTLRVTFVAMQPYQEEYSNRDSLQFQNFSKSLANAVNKVYEEQARNGEIGGTQRASLVRIQSRTSDDFSCKVTLDIVTTGYYDMNKITEILRNHIRGRRSLEGVVVDERDFSANVIDPASTESCPLDWIRCDAAACLPLSVRCNGEADCADGTDEAGCPPETANMIPREEIDTNTEAAEPQGPKESFLNRECHQDELLCDFTRCVSLSKRCDGLRDCDDNSDELNCTPIEGQDCKSLWELIRSTYEQKMNTKSINPAAGSQNTSFTKIQPQGGNFYTQEVERGNKADPAHGDQIEETYTASQVTPVKEDPLCHGHGVSAIDIGARKNATDCFTLQNQNLNSNQDPNCHPKDPSEMFLLSLLPHLTSMSPQQQLRFQRGVLDLIENIKYKSTNSTSL